jgi:phosphatidate cytidylyltransferase
MAEPPDDGSAARRHPRRAPRNEFEARAQATVADFEAGVRGAKAQFDATNERIRARTGRNLLAAIAIGVLLGGLLLVSILIWKPLFMIFGAAVIGFTVFELAGALRFAGRDVPRLISTVVAVAVVPAAFFLHVQGLWLATLAAVAIVTVWRLVELVRPSHRTGARALVADIGAGALVQVYVTFMAGFYVVLSGSAGGEWWMLASLIVVVVTDVGAYASGLAFGRHKLAPTISPGKTWEGFAGSILAALIAGILLAWLMLGQPWWVGAIMGVLLALAGTAGDLTESLLKRELGIKDISAWLPGHGGFLDRLDSILPAAAVAYAIFLLAGAAGAAA